MSAPTAEEIRQAAFAAILEAQPVDDAWGNASLAFDRILWDTSDLRKSEQDRLDELAEPFYNRVQKRLEAILIEEMIAHGEQFAAEHPEAPRAKVEVAA
jgi:hypothetical protein